MPGARSPKRLIFTVAPKYFRSSVLRLASCSSSGAKIFDIASRLLENMCNFGDGHSAQRDQTFFEETFHMEVNRARIDSYSVMCPVLNNDLIHRKTDKGQFYSTALVGMDGK
jgi:hypothetical protein